MSAPSRSLPTVVGSDVVTPPPAREAAPRVLASGATTLSMLVRGRLHHPRERVGSVIAFADGSTARVYRETRVDDGVARDPVVLVVGFVLRRVHGRVPHAAFRVESWLNTPMFAGFHGLASKLWLTADHHDVYRGVYEWDGAERAADYVRALSWVLGLVCFPGSVRAHVAGGVHRDEVLAQPAVLGPARSEEDRWWRPVTHRPA